MNNNGISAPGPDTSSATKRVRIETQRVNVSATTSSLAATKTTFVNGTLALHISLQDTVAREAKPYAELLKLLRSKEKSLNKYDNDETFIPQSL